MFTQNSKPFRLLRRIAGYDLELRIGNFELRILSIIMVLQATTALFIFCITISSAFAQKKQIDSLSKLISIEKTDSNIVKLNNKLAWAYFQAKEPNTAQKLVLQNIEKAQNISWNKGIANSYETIGDFYSYENKTDSAVFFYINSIKFYKKTTDLPQVCYMLGKVGEHLSHIRKFSESKQYLIEGLDLSIKINHSTYQIQCLVGLGWLYHNLGNYAKSLDYFYQAEKLALQIKNKQKQIDVASGIGNDFIAQGKYKEAQNRYFEIAEYYKSLNDRYSYADNLSTAANLYRKLNQPQKAEKPLLEVYQIQKELNYEWGLLSTSRFLGMLYTEQKRFKKAEKYLLESLKLSNQFNNGSDKLKASYSLERLFYAKNDFVEGDKYQKKILHLRDSLYTADNNKALAEFDIKYKTAEKERQLTEAKLENAQKQKWIVVLSIAVLSILGFGFAFNKIREAKQKAILQEIEIEKQREILKAREIERQRIAKELHDSVGSQLTVVSTSLDNAFFLAENQKLVPQKLESINKDVREAAQSLRDTIWATHNTTVSVSNLFSRMQHYLQKVIKENSDTEVESSFSGKDIELNSIQALNFFRIFQEAIQNIQKHAEASKVLLLIQNENDSLRMRIEDNGKGFGINTKNLYENFGLSNMKTRSDEIGAKISIESTVDKGTIIEVIKEMTS